MLSSSTQFRKRDAMGFDRASGVGLMTGVSADERRRL
jgi:hypothetical protein